MDSVLVAPISVLEGSPEALLYAAGGEGTQTEQPTDDPSAQVPTDGATPAASDDTGYAPETIAAPTESAAAPAIAPVDTTDIADEADLLTYPEAVRDRFKKLPRADRRAFWEHASAGARAEVEAANARAAEVKRVADENDARARAVAESQGKYVGYSPIELPDGQGGTIKGPTFDELQQLLSSGQYGRNELWTRYGLDEDVAIATRNELQGRREMLTSTTGHLEREVWGKTAWKFKNGLVGLLGSESSADAMVDGAGGPEGVLARVGQWHQREMDALNDQHQRERAVERKNYEDRLGAAAAEQEALSGRALAGSMRDPATGGRSAGGSSRELTLEEYQRLTPEQAAGIPRSEIDRLTSRLTGQR
jgi:hypothetical protein